MLYLACGLILVLAMTLPSAGWAETLVVAHRGASFDAPENTLAAFRLAWEQGADGIEGDFRLTRDGRIVCIHDADTKRVSGQEMVVRDATLAELKRLDVGAWKGDAWRGEKIPTLEEVLAVVPRDKYLFIELKSGAEIVAPLAEALARAKSPFQRLVVICFDADVLIASKAALPNVKRHYLADYRRDDDGAWTPPVDEVIKRIKHSGANGFGTQNQLAYFDSSFVKKLRGAGIGEFHVWTVDDVLEAKRYRQLGAWGITTNRPVAIHGALDNR